MQEADVYAYFQSGLKAQRSRYTGLLLLLAALFAFWLSVEALHARYMQQFDATVQFHRDTAALRAAQADALAAIDPRSRQAIEDARATARERDERARALAERFAEERAELAAVQLELQLLGTSVQADPVIAPLLLLLAVTAWIWALKSTADYGALSAEKLSELLPAAHISPRIGRSKSLWLVWPAAAERLDTQVMEARYDARRANQTALQMSFYAALLLAAWIAWRAMLTVMVLTGPFARDDIGLKATLPTGVMTFLALTAFSLFVAALLILLLPRRKAIDEALVRDRRGLLVALLPAVAISAWIGLRRTDMPRLGTLNQLAPTSPELAAQQPLCQPSTLTGNPRFVCRKPQQAARTHPDVVLEEAALKRVREGDHAAAAALIASELPRSIRRASRSGKPMPWRLIDLQARLEPSGRRAPPVIASLAAMADAIATIENPTLRQQEARRLQQRLRADTPKGPWHWPHQTRPPATFLDFLFARQSPARAVAIGL